MKRLKEKSVAKLLSSVVFLKKYTSILSFLSGALVGIIRYIVCRSFQCAFGYFIGASLIVSLVLILALTILQIITKRQIMEHYVDSIGTHLSNEDKKALNIAVKKEDTEHIENNNKENKAQ